MATVALEPPRATPRQVLGRITDRRSFGRLRRQGARATAGVVSVVWVAPREGGGARPRAAFAVGRRTGGAVLRNRVRRRLRAALAQLAAEGRLPAGDYLVSAGAGAATMPWPDLCAAVGDAVQVATAGRR